MALFLLLLAQRLSFNTIARASGTFYAVRNVRLQEDNKRVVIKMHREILRVPDEMFVDHINHNGLDNRKANLRSATRAQNTRNRRKDQKSNFHSKYKGLTWYRRKKRWAVRIIVDGKSKFIGYFDNEIDDAKAYDTAAKKIPWPIRCFKLPRVSQPPTRFHSRDTTHERRVTNISRPVRRLTLFLFFPEIVVNIRPLGIANA